MKYIAAYYLLTLGGNSAPTASDIIALLATVGIEAESERVDVVVAQLSGTDTDELISEGTSRLASLPSGTSVDNTVAPVVVPAVENEEEEVKEGDDDDDDDAIPFSYFD